MCLQTYLGHEREVHRKKRRLLAILPPHCAIQRRPPACLIRGNKCHTQALCTRTRCSAGAVDVGVRRRRQLVVHHTPGVRVCVCVCACVIYYCV